MNRILTEDIADFVSSFELTEHLNCSKFLITGATGLIGSTLVHCLLALNNGISITCPVRNIVKAKKMFCDEFSRINFVETELLPFLNQLTISDEYDYVVHCASPTAGSYMKEHPVETFELAVESTKALLNYCKTTNIKSMVFLSSIEYYGQILDDRIITEDVLGYIDSSDSRSSYPIGKRASEFMCASYAKEFSLNVKCARLTQTFGAGVSSDDNRVFAQFARSIIQGTDIVLHTKGESAKPYCYTTDTVSAILYILLKGEPGESYNVANKDTFISIKEMAEFLTYRFNPSVKIIIDENNDMGYAPVTKLNLSTKKIESLGWKPRKDLYSMFKNLLLSMKCNN